MQIVHDATLVRPRLDSFEVLPRHSLIFDEQQVHDVVPAAAARMRIERGEFELVVPGADRLVIPGLINTHHHLFQSLTRGLPAAQNAQLFEWLTRLYPHWRRLTRDALRAAARVSLAELLLHGCTTTSDHMYLFPPGQDLQAEIVLEAASELGIRLHLCRGSMTLGRARGGLPPDDCVESDEDALRDSARMIDQFHDPRPYAMRRIDLAPCSPFNVSRELVRDTLSLARTHGVLLHTHLAETLDEQRYCLDGFGCRPLRYLEELGFLGPDVYLAHCVHLSRDEIATIAATRAGVAHCPTSNLRLGSGLAPVRELLDAGARVGIGVDGASSNDGGNLLAEARLTTLAMRLRQVLAEPEQGALALEPAVTALRLATVGGASVLNREELGRLDPGSASDFAIFRTDDVALAGAVAHDPVAALVLCDAPRAESVVVSGRWVVRDGHLTGADESQLAAELNRLARALP